MNKKDETFKKYKDNTFYDWEVEAIRRIECKIKGDKKAEKILKELIKFTRMKDFCAGR